MSKSHLKSFLLISFKPKFLDYLLHSGCFSLLKPPEQDEIMFEQLLLTNSTSTSGSSNKALLRALAPNMRTTDPLGDLVSPFPTLDCCWCDAQCAAQSNIPPCPAAKEKIWESSNRWECISERKGSARERKEAHWRLLWMEADSWGKRVFKSNMTCFN